MPNLVRYLDEDKGLVPWTWWPQEETGHSDEAKKEILSLFPGVEPFDTPKPERLMRRIIHIATNPGDVVLDCFLGSGTTVAVAHKMGRRWIGIERMNEALDTFSMPRLEEVVGGQDSGGITDAVDWNGGGGFRLLEVAPSMFEAAGGQVYLSEWATNGRLAEATAAQLGYDYCPDPPFAGRKGRARLAVVDGLVNADVVRLLVPALAANERLVICGTAVDPLASEELRALRPGSTARKIPQSILREYRQGARWEQLPVFPPMEETAQPDGAADLATAPSPA